MNRTVSKDYRSRSCGSLGIRERKISRYGMLNFDYFTGYIFVGGRTSDIIIVKKYYGNGLFLIRKRI